MSVKGADILVSRTAWDRLDEKTRDDLARHIESEVEAARAAVSQLLVLDPPRGAVVDTALASLPEVAARLARYPWRLAWPVLDSRVGGIGAADRADPGQVMNDAGRVDWSEHAVLRHEVAHALARTGRSGGKGKRSQRGYGTELPDWLDELPAIFAEDESLSRRRRALWHGFCKRSGRLPFSLPSFFAMEHPLWKLEEFRAAAGLQEGIGVPRMRGPRTIILSRAAFQAVSDEAAMYYAQLRGLIDFLADENRLAVVPILMKEGEEGKLQDPSVALDVFRREGVALTEERLFAYCAGKA